MYLDYLQNDKPYYAIDIEADSLTPKTVWCMSWHDIRSNDCGILTTYKDIYEFFQRDAIFIGHNIVRYDAKALNRIVGTKISLTKVVDTLLLCTLYSPNIENGHSLEEWAKRLGMQKGDFNDWSCLSDEMITYCQQDARITAELFRRIVKTLNNIGFSEQSCYTQHYVTHAIDKQQTNGFFFNKEEADILYSELRNREHQLQEIIRNAFPAERRLVRDGRVYLKDGGHSKRYDLDLLGYYVEQYDGGNRYRAYEDVHFNIGSPKQRVEKLVGLGWQPTEFTPTGQPKPTEQGLIEFSESSGIPEVSLITKWMAINGRANMVNTWLENYNNETHCIHGKLFTADTLRFRHNSPNTANVPAVRVSKKGDILFGEDGYFTYESRNLWTARPGRILVGTDAAGLELRMLAHYLNRPAFTKEVLGGDPHQYNADLAGVTRPRAKTLLYAIQYGAQAAKVASIINGSLQEGKELRQLFLDRLGLSDIMNEAINEQRQGRILLVDGSRIKCPSPHSALNYKLQGGGARVMALGTIILEGYIRYYGLDSLKVGDIHDEWQYDVAVKDADEHARLSVLAIQEAGRRLNLNLPLDGTAKKGMTWAETH